MNTADLLRTSAITSRTTGVVDNYFNQIRKLSIRNINCCVMYSKGFNYLLEMRGYS